MSADALLMSIQTQSRIRSDVQPVVYIVYKSSTWHSNPSEHLFDKSTRILCVAAAHVCMAQGCNTQGLPDASDSQTVHAQ